MDSLERYIYMNSLVTVDESFYLFIYFFLENVIFKKKCVKT